MKPHRSASHADHKPKGAKRGVCYFPRFLIQNLAIFWRGIEMRNNPLIFCVSRVIQSDTEEVTVRGSLRRYCNKEWIIVRPLCCFNSFYEGVVWAAYLSDFVQDG